MRQIERGVSERENKKESESHQEKRVKSAIERVGEH
jgi:hypothetical protein